MRERARIDPHDIYGRKKPERIGDYFDFEKFPDKANLNVKRFELQALLVQYDRAARSRTFRGFLRRVWRFLKRPLGSKLTDETGVESPEVNAP